MAWCWCWVTKLSSIISDHKKNEKDTPRGSLLTIMFNYLFRAFIFFIQLFKFLDWFCYFQKSAEPSLYCLNLWCCPSGKNWLAENGGIYLQIPCQSGYSWRFCARSHNSLVRPNYLQEFNLISFYSQSVVLATVKFQAALYVGQINSYQPGWPNRLTGTQPNLILFSVGRVGAR